LDAKNKGTALPQPDPEEEKDKEIASAARALLLAALTIIPVSTLVAYIAYIFHLLNVLV
jgi:hypothetical protein